MAGISDTFNVGIADTNQIVSNANARSRNIMSTAFSSAMSNIANSVGMSAMGGGGFDLGGGGASTFGSQGAFSRLAEFGSPSAQGPVQGWGGS